MTVTSSFILRRHLGPLLKEERLSRGQTPQQVAVECDLAAETIMQIENGERVSIQKYLRLMRHYRKNMKVELVDK